jgi:hypothetical protein
MAKLNESKRFLHSMAPRALGVSHYPLIIRHPMAIADIRWKLHHDMYSSMQSFAADLRPMLDNAFQFNERYLIDISQLQLTRARVCSATGDLSHAKWMCPCRLSIGLMNLLVFDLTRRVCARKVSRLVLRSRCFQFICDPRDVEIIANLSIWKSSI